MSIKFDPLVALNTFTFECVHAQMSVIVSALDVGSEFPNVVDEWLTPDSGGVCQALL